jgi:DNA-binding transcriptional LysR family regulator
MARAEAGVRILGSTRIFRASSSQLIRCGARAGLWGGGPPRHSVHDLPTAYRDTPVITVMIPFPRLEAYAAAWTARSNQIGAIKRWLQIPVESFC